MKEYNRCVELLDRNNAKLIDATPQSSTYDLNCFGIEVLQEDNEIVFIDGTGDFLPIPLNYYALFGALIIFGIGVKR